MLQKDDAEHSIPEQWRSRFRHIVDAFVAGDFQLRDHSIEGVAPVDSETARRIESNISDYGDTLAPLNEETWDRSLYRWMENYWEMLVDLSTEREIVSDLALHARLHEAADSRLEIHSVHVP